MDKYSLKKLKQVSKVGLLNKEIKLLYRGKSCEIVS